MTSPSWERGTGLEVDFYCISCFNPTKRGAFQVRFREEFRRIYKGKMEIFSILDIYAHNFNYSGTLENKY